MFVPTVLLLLAVAAAAKIVYERRVSPLAKIPGPFLYSITSVPLRYFMLRGRVPELLLEMHRRYGLVVRISPQRVSVSDLGAVRRILGTHAFRKARVFGMTNVFEPNTLTTKSPEVNIERRRLLGPGFSHKHLKDMEGAILQCGVTNLHGAIDKQLQKGSAVLQYKKLFSLTTFDVIGKLGFGQDFGSLRNGDHELMSTLEFARKLSHVCATLPWLGQLVGLFGVVPQSLRMLETFASNAINRRRDSRRPPAPDLLQLMLDAGEEDGPRQALTDAQMVSETALHLNAGMETTAIGMTYALLLLLHNPHILRRLTADIRREFPMDREAPITFDECRERLPYLSATINESLRLASPAPYLTRLVQPEGMWLHGCFCPRGTIIYCALDVIHRDPDVFPSPDVFNPDRFMGESSTSAKQRLLAFSIGVRVCLGRNLALFEMHVVLANLLRNYNLWLPGASSGTLIASDLASEGKRKVDDDKQTGAGIVPDIPHDAILVRSPACPDRDCLVAISRA